MVNISYEIFGKYILFEGVLWLVVYICEVVLIFFGNFVIVYIFWNIWKWLKCISYLFINFVVVDVLVGIVIMFFFWEVIVEILDWWDVNYRMVIIVMMVDFIGIIFLVLLMILIFLEWMFVILWFFCYWFLNVWCYYVFIGFIWFVLVLNMFLNLYFDFDIMKVDNVYSILMVIIYISLVVIIVFVYVIIWILMIWN